MSDSAKQKSASASASSFSLSNLQVILILLVVGACLLVVTFGYAKDIGRVPVSLWDICTTALSGDDKPSSGKPDNASPSTGSLNK